MSSALFSPTVSTSSSSHLDIPDDIDMSLALDNSVQGFEDLFNFDEFDSSAETTVSDSSCLTESDGEAAASLLWLTTFIASLPSPSQSHTHSPYTASPNHTPSPLPHHVQEPFTFNPSSSFDFLDNDFPVDFMLGSDFKQPPPSMRPQPAQEMMKVKQEPMEFSFGEASSSSQSPVSVDAQVRPVPIPQPLAALPQTSLDTDELAFSGLPIDQQAALQQLMNNILNYQKQFGTDMADSAAPPAPMPSTVQPSMVFNNTNAFPDRAFANVPNAPKLSPSSSTSVSVTHASPALPPFLAIPENDADPEPLRSIEAHESASPDASRSVRQGSTFSSIGDDLDHKLDRLVPLPAIFSAGKGKGGKKGGGMSSVVRGDDEDLDDDDSWRPSPEEYKKLSSKEKRQLRNKLSARAFRTRRKDYIGTLECHIKDRDTVIDEMRAELVNSRTENQDLRRELDALKTSTMSILHPETATKTSVSPAMINALAMSPSLAIASVSGNATAGPGPNTLRRTQTPLNTYNPRKDIGSPSTKGFWGNDNMFGGGSTICHTMFTPDLVLPSLAAPKPTPLRSFADLPRVNINPMLNDDAPMPPAVAGPPNSLAHVGNGRDVSASFAEWADATPFSLRSMDSYRMQMWSRLAREAAADKANLSGEMRPKFFVEASAAALDDKADEATAAALATAAIATSHITTKLATSFWSAFQGSGKTLDTDKLAAVVTGTARLKVVSTDKEKSALAAAAAEEELQNSQDSLSALMGGLKLQSGPGLVRGMGARENPLGTLCGFLRHASAMPARA